MEALIALEVLWADLCDLASRIVAVPVVIKPSSVVEIDTIERGYGPNRAAIQDVLGPPLIPFVIRVVGENLGREVCVLETVFTGIECEEFLDEVRDGDDRGTHVKGVAVFFADVGDDPGLSSASTMVVSKPMLWRRMAIARPPKPAPITTGMVGCLTHGDCVPSVSVSSGAMSFWAVCVTRR